MLGAFDGSREPTILSGQIISFSLLIWCNVDVLDTTRSRPVAVPCDSTNSNGSDFRDSPNVESMAGCARAVRTVRSVARARVARYGNVQKSIHGREWTLLSRYEYQQAATFLRTFQKASFQNSNLARSKEVTGDMQVRILAIPQSAHPADFPRSPLLLDYLTAFLGIASMILPQRRLMKLFVVARSWLMLAVGACFSP